MENNIEKRSVPAILGALPKADNSLINVGSGNQVGSIGAVNVNGSLSINFNGISKEDLLLFSQWAGQKRCTPMEMSALSHERYNLFVMENEDYNDGAFSIWKKYIFKYMPKEEFSRYHKLGPVEVAEIRKFPTVLAVRNKFQKHTDDNQPFLLGVIDDITNQGQTFKIKFRTDGTLYNQQILNLWPDKFDILTTSLINEIDEVHWEIKHADLLTVLSEFTKDMGDEVWNKKFNP